jgi:hypothetical protein
LAGFFGVWIFLPSRQGGSINFILMFDSLEPIFEYFLLFVPSLNSNCSLNRPQTLVFRLCASLPTEEFLILALRLVFAVARAQVTNAISLRSWQQMMNTRNAYMDIWLPRPESSDSIISLIAAAFANIFQDSGIIVQKLQVTSYNTVKLCNGVLMKIWMLE